MLLSVIQKTSLKTSIIWLAVLSSSIGLVACGGGGGGGSSTNTSGDSANIDPV